jgi:aspartate carbamoyltransferase catalytic subunit
LKNLEELHLVYTINDEELIPIVQNMNLKKLVISGDLLSTKENKSLLNDLKKKGVKIEIVGPVI